jgi:acyl carrier protein
LQVSELGLDSLGLIEMLFEVEDQYGFQIPEPMRFLGMSYAEMVADIEATVSSHHSGEFPSIDSPAVSSLPDAPKTAPIK